MRSRDDVIALLTHPGIIAVIRAETIDHILPACDTLIAAGITAIEITLTTPDALNLVRRVRERIETSATVGIGSVLSAGACARGLDAGAEFLVSPITKPEIVAIGRAAGRPVMLGAYTPTEAQEAWEAGADFVKIFPADTLGPDYVRSLRAPMPHLKIVPTGGIDLNNAADFFKAGCAAIGVGSALVSSRILESEDWPELTRRARAFVDITAQRP